MSAGWRPQAAPAVIGPVRNDIIAGVAGRRVYAVFVAWAHRSLIGVPLMP
jgi:hypothetical protein